MDGLEALAAFKKIDREVPVIVLSGQGLTTTVVQAMKLGAADFVCKPFNEHDLDVPLANALKQRQLSREVATLREELQSQSRYHMLFGNSDRMAEVRELIERVADTDVTVLIRGESGTGKELVARALYASSLRRDKPFVKVNCAALPTELLESELFGFERGAFTGAIQQKPGKFEFANHGTMFLDEIGDMSFPLQAKLLQVLQDGEFARLGGKHDVRVDVRVIAATNRDLDKAVADGQFREDLYFRLNVVAITLPPLRDRREEIPLLTELLPEEVLRSIQQAASRDRRRNDAAVHGARLARQHPRAGERDQARGGAGHRIADSQGAQPEHGAWRCSAPPSPGTCARRRLPPPRRRRAGTRVPLAPVAMAAAAFEAGNYSLKDISRSAAREAERELILRMLQQTRWNRKETAEILGISYKALLYKIKENGLDKAS